MTKAEAAKNILENKTCALCFHRRVGTRTDRCGFGIRRDKPSKKRLPFFGTCKKYQSKEEVMKNLASRALQNLTDSVHAPAEACKEQDEAELRLNKATDKSKWPREKSKQKDKIKWQGRNRFRQKQLKPGSCLK